jgi:hypothetical protein
MSINDKIADIIAEHWCSLTGGIDQHDMADAILEALPDMIAPLVWDDADHRLFVLCSASSYAVHAKQVRASHHASPYDLCLFFEGEKISDWTMACEGLAYELKAKANTHHRDAIMAALTGETQ